MRQGPDKEKSRRVDPPAPARRPTQAQWRYLERGLTQAGGKLPLFDRNGREVSRKTIESCIAQGWATPWMHNPIKPDWLVCRLTGGRLSGAGAVSRRRKIRRRAMVTPGREH